MDRVRAERFLQARRHRLEAEARRRGEAERVKGEIPKVCESLRSFFHPKQAAFFQGKHRRKATKKTRRAGATSGGCRELIARALETPGFRAIYAAKTRDEAEDRAWKSDTKSGFVDVLRQFGKRLERPGVERVLIAGIEVAVRHGDLELEFSNGSHIELFGADHIDDFDKKRGTQKHVFWVDEAQGFPDLSSFYKGVIVGCLTDFKGECWLTGTPGRTPLGFFFDITRDDGEPRLEGWEVHEITVVDNPFFGRPVQVRDVWHVVDNTGTYHGPYADEAAAEREASKIRWTATAGEAIQENGWSEDDPDLLREWFARWVKEGAAFVYSAHSVPEHQLCFAPQRLDSNGFPDIRAALLDLPGYEIEERDYFLALGADLGTRAAFAFVVWAWSLKDPILYEVASWKKPGLDYDEMANYLRAVREQAVIGMMVADAGGGGKPAVMGWSKKWVSRYALPIKEATKQNKVVAINQLNTDLRKGLLKVRTGSPLLVEWKSHVWAPQRSDKGGLVESPKTKRDCADAGLYAHRESFHHRYRAEDPPPDPGTEAYWARAEQRVLEASTEEDRNEPAWWG